MVSNNDEWVDAPVQDAPDTEWVDAPVDAKYGEDIPTVRADAEGNLLPSRQQVEFEHRNNELSKVVSAQILNDDANVFNTPEKRNRYYKNLEGRGYDFNIVKTAGEQANQYAETFRELKPAVEKGDLQATQMAGDILANTGQYKDAMNFYTKVLAANPDYPKAQYGMYFVLDRLGRKKEAQDYAEGAQRYINEATDVADPRGLEQSEEERLRPYRERMQNVVGAMEMTTMPFTAPAHSYEAAFKSLKESGAALEEGKTTLGFLKGVKAFAEGAIGGAMAAPSGILFNAATQAAEMGGANTEWVFALPTKLVQAHGDYENLSEEKKTALSLMDLAVVGFAMHQMGKPFTRIKSEAPAREAVIKAQAEMTPNQAEATLNNLESPKLAKLQTEVLDARDQAQKTKVPEVQTALFDYADSKQKQYDQGVAKQHEEDAVTAFNEHRDDEVAQLQALLEKQDNPIVQRALKDRIKKLSNQDELPETAPGKEAETSKSKEDAKITGGETADGGPPQGPDGRETGRVRVRNAKKNRLEAQAGKEIAAKPEAEKEGATPTPTSNEGKEESTQGRQAEGKKQDVLTSATDQTTVGERGTPASESSMEPTVSVSPEHEFLRTNADFLSDAQRARLAELDKAPPAPAAEPPLDDAAIQAAYAEREKELKRMKGGDYKAQIIHDNFAPIRESDWAQYGDKNWLAGKEGKNFRRQFINNKEKQPLDEFAMHLSEMAGVDIQPQDVVDYIMDRAVNKGKYRKGKMDVHELNKAKAIPENSIDNLITFVRDQGYDATTEKAINDLRGFPLSDAEADLLIEYLKSDEARKELSDSEPSAPATPPAEPTGEGASLEGKAATEGQPEPATGAEKLKASVDRVVQSTIDLFKENKIISDDPAIQKMGLVDLERAIRFVGEVIKQGIDLHGDLKRAVKDAIENFRQSKFYKSLAPETQRELEDKVEQRFGVEEATAIAQEFGYESPTHFINATNKRFGTAYKLAQEIPGEQRIQREKMSTSIKNAQVDAEREARGLSPLMSEAARRWGSVWNTAMQRIEDGQNPVKLAEDILENKRPASDVEGAVLDWHRVSIHNEYQNAMGKFLEALNGKDPVAQELWQNELARLDQEKALNDEAARVAGRETARGLAFRRAMVNEDYTLASVVSRIAAERGFDVTPEERVQIEKLTADYEAKAKAYEAHIQAQDERISKLEAERAIEDEQRAARKQRRERSREAIQQERADIIAHIKELARKSRGELHSLVSPELAKDLLALAKTYIAEGGLKAEEIVDRIYSDVKDYVDGISQRDIRDAISGYGRPKETRQALTSQINDIKAQLRVISKIEDAEAGLVAESSVAKKRIISKELADLRLKLKDILAAQRKPSDIEAIIARKLQTYKKNLERRQQDLERRIETEDFSQPTRFPVPMDEEAMRMKADVQKARDRLDELIEKERLANRKALQKTLDFVNRWRREFILSGVHTLGKLTAYATGKSLVLTPAEEIVGGILSMPLKVIASRAPRHGGFDAGAVAKSYTQWVRAESYRDIWETAKTGVSDLDRTYGNKKEFPPELRSYMGQLHGALKVLPKQAEFWLSYEKRMRNAMESGIDVSDPVVQETVGAAAYKDALEAILMEDNKFVSDYTSWIRRAETSGSTKQQLLAFAAKFMLPIVKIPTNYVRQTLQYSPVGAAEGLARGARALMRGVDSLKPEEADMIMKLLKRGSVGSAIILMGYFNPEAFGGYYQPNDKRKATDVKYGSIRIGDVDVPTWLVHNPVFEALQWGSTIRRVSDKKVKGQPQGLAKGIGRGVFGLFTQLPFANIAEDFSALLSGDRDPAQWFGRLVQGSTEPRVLQEVAEWMDPLAEARKRSPHGFSEQMKMGIPVLREEIPSKKR